MTTRTLHAFKGLADWIEVFRAGDHTDSKGRSVSFTEADIDQMVANLPADGAPAVLGHPKHNDPAYAWAREAKREGGSLFVKFSDVNPAFEAGVDSGAYRRRSISTVKTPNGWALNHIGWLGAAPPAIEGLKPLEFSDSADAHEFAVDDEWLVGSGLDSVAGALRGLRDWLIEQSSLEVADRVLPSWTIDSVAQTAQRLRDAAMAEEASPFIAPHNPDDPGAPTMPSFTQADLDRAAAETEARVRAEFTAANADTAAELARLQGERQRERIAAQITAWQALGLVLPAEAAGLAEFMADIEREDAEFTFSAADGAEAKKTRAVWFSEFMAGRKPLVRLGQRLADDPTPTAVDVKDPTAMAAAASEFQRAEQTAGRTVSLSAAMQHVIDVAEQAR